MELEQRVSVSANDYEENEGMQKSQPGKTEDIYQCLQNPSPQVQFNKHTTFISESWQKYGFLLFAVNILILIIILAIVGKSYSLQKETHLTEVAKTQTAKKNKEGWLLHDNVFYLFWNDHSDCSAADRFCAERNASLVTLTSTNKVWLHSRANGKQFLVLYSSDGSADYSLDSEDVSYDEDDQTCGIMTPDINKDHSEGFICQRVIKCTSRCP